ncbi:MAG: hypothetical protein ABIB98_00680 [bacterium]
MAHSVRFSYPKKARDILEEAMYNCNLAVVYLKQYRDLMESKKDATSKIVEKIYGVQ